VAVPPRPQWSRPRLRWTAATRARDRRPHPAPAKGAAQASDRRPHPGPSYRPKANSAQVHPNESETKTVHLNSCGKNLFGVFIRSTRIRCTRTNRRPKRFTSTPVVKTFSEFSSDQICTVSPVFLTVLKSAIETFRSGNTDGRHGDQNGSDCYHLGGTHNLW
jgi:hypothetical protein